MLHGFRPLGPRASRTISKRTAWRRRAEATSSSAPSGSGRASPSLSRSAGVISGSSPGRFPRSKKAERKAGIWASCGRSLSLRRQGCPRCSMRWRVPRTASRAMSHWPRCFPERWFATRTKRGIARRNASRGHAPATMSSWKSQATRTASRLVSSRIGRTSAASSHCCHQWTCLARIPAQEGLEDSSLARRTWAIRRWRSPGPGLGCRLSRTRCQAAVERSQSRPMASAAACRTWLSGLPHQAATSSSGLRTASRRRPTKLARAWSQGAVRYSYQWRNKGSASRYHVERPSDRECRTPAFSRRRATWDAWEAVRSKACPSSVGDRSRGAKASRSTTTCSWLDRSAKRIW